VIAPTSRSRSFIQAVSGGFERMTAGAEAVSLSLHTATGTNMQKFAPVKGRVPDANLSCESDVRAVGADADQKACRGFDQHRRPVRSKRHELAVCGLSAST
jgi:hypothetical protein